MNKKMATIIMLVVIGALVVSAFSWAAITNFNGSQRALAGDLTSLNAAEASAYRWNAMAGFYAAQNPQSGDLSKYYASEKSSAAKASAFGAAQQGLATYHQSEWNYVQAMPFHYGPPGR